MTFQNNPNQIGSYDFVLLPSPCSAEFSHIRGAPSDAFWGMGWESGWNGWPPRRKGKKRINSGGFGWVSWMMTRLLLWTVLLWMLLHLGKMKCICIKYIYIDEIWMVIFSSFSWSQNSRDFCNARTGPPLLLTGWTHHLYLTPWAPFGAYGLPFCMVLFGVFTFLQYPSMGSVFFSWGSISVRSGFGHRTKTFWAINNPVPKNTSKGESLGVPSSFVDFAFVGLPFSFQHCGYGSKAKPRML